MEEGGDDMYVFTIVVLLGLAAAAVCAVTDRFLVRIPEIRTGLLLVLGIAFAWVADFNVFTLWAMPLREYWMEIGATGLIIGGIGLVSYEVVAYVGTLMRKIHDEALTIEKTEQLRLAS